jgi:transcriptional regulator with XRE-family HTH domain
MQTTGKRGRKKRPRTTAEKLLMAEFSEKLCDKMKEEGWTAKRTAKELKICPASFYNYRNKTDLPSYEVLKRAHDRWGWNFKYIDFAEQSARAPSEAEQPRQYVLPFIENVQERDIQVIRAKAVKPDCLELTVQIRFAS